MAAIRRWRVCIFHVLLLLLSIFPPFFGCLISDSFAEIGKK
jgi:hypothetical protein